MKHETSGERLFFFIKDHVLPSLGDAGASWRRLEEVHVELSGGKGLNRYLQGAVALYATRRVLHLWDEMMTQGVAENARVATASRVATHEMFPGLGRDLSARLGRLVVEACAASGRPISPSTRKQVLGKATAFSCYLCGAHLNLKTVTLEHLWPRSVGGESIPANLLPACEECQKAKANAPSWEGPPIHMLVLPANPSAEALKSVDWSFRIARHYFHAIDRCVETRMSLKTTFLAMGPVCNPISYRPRGLPVTFFELETV